MSGSTSLIVALTLVLSITTLVGMDGIKFLSGKFPEGKWRVSYFFNDMALQLAH